MHDFKIDIFIVVQTKGLPNWARSKSSPVVQTSRFHTRLCFLEPKSDIKVTISVTRNESLCDHCPQSEAAHRINRLVLGKADRRDPVDAHSQDSDEQVDERDPVGKKRPVGDRGAEKHQHNHQVEEENQRG